MNLNFSLGYTNNKDSNDFLRCLWASLRKEFGKAAWNILPLRDGTNIFLGHCDLGLEDSVEISLNYKVKGCLNTMTFSFEDEICNNSLKSKIKSCVKYARNNFKKVKTYELSIKLSSCICFEEIQTENFALKGNIMTITVFGYDLIDAKTLATSLLKTVCAWLSFDTLCYISLENSPFSIFKKSLNYNFRKVQTCSLKVSKQVLTYISKFLSKVYLYEDMLWNVDKCILVFTQGLKNEDLAKMTLGLPETYYEQSILCYMSALEILTLQDVEPIKCEQCGQLRYSITRRVEDLVFDVSHSKRMSNLIRELYDYRSKFVHEGEMLSENNYLGTSIPLMNKGYGNGIIQQCNLGSFDLAQIVKESIIYRMKNGLDKNV